MSDAQGIYSWTFKILKKTVNFGIDDIYIYIYFYIYINILGPKRWTMDATALKSSESTGNGQSGQKASKSSRITCQYPAQIRHQLSRSRKFRKIVDFIFKTSVIRPRNVENNETLGIPVAHYSLHGQCRTWGATFSMSALRTDVH